MKWQCWLFPWDLNASIVKALIDDSLSTKMLVVGSDSFEEAVSIISAHGGGEIRLRPVFTEIRLGFFDLFRIYPRKVFTVSDRVFGVNLDYVSELEPYKKDVYGEYKNRLEFYSNKPNLKANQFCILDFCDHLCAPKDFKLEDIELFPLRSLKQEVWQGHHVLNTLRIADDFLIDESVDIVDTDRHFKRPNFKGLLTLKMNDYQSLGSLFKLPGPGDLGDSFWGCSKEFYSLYQKSGFTGLSFQPILLDGTEIYKEYISEWSEILNYLNKHATWKSIC